MQGCKVKSVYVNRTGRCARRGGYTLTKGEIEEDTQRWNWEHRKRGIIATSKVRAAITIANVSPRDKSLLLCSWFSELPRLPSCDNAVWIANSLVGDMAT